MESQNLNEFGASRIRNDFDSGQLFIRHEFKATADLDIDELLGTSRPPKVKIIYARCGDCLVETIGTTLNRKPLTRCSY
jgi:hypothetical protein